MPKTSLEFDRLTEPQIRAPYEDPAAASLLFNSPTPRRALFLDRDGVINEDLGYVHKAADTRFLDGIFDRVHTAIEAGYIPIVVTNQAGIARGYYSENDFLEYTAWMHMEFAKRGLHLLATYFCPHHPTAGNGALTCACICRKPGPGMLEAAASRYQLSLADSHLIGDKPTDIEAAMAAGIGSHQLINQE